MSHQLDIFDDSRDVALRNDLARALLDGDADQAQHRADALRAEFGTDPVLAPAAELIEHLRRRRSQPESEHFDVAEVLGASTQLGGTVTAASSRVLNAHDASIWLADQWRWLAGRAKGIAWNPAHADAHAAALYLRARAWQHAADAAAGIESWRRIPVPLLWMAQARWRSDGADAAWPLLAEALWLAPARAAALLRTLADRDFGRLLDRFEERFEPAGDAAAEWAWLPAFAVVDRPLLAGVLSSANAPAETATGEAFRVVQALLRLERQGRHHEIVAQRARLKTLSAPLFGAYMSTR